DFELKAEPRTLADPRWPSHDRRLAALASADAHGVVNREDEDEAVADDSCACGSLDRQHSQGEPPAGHDRLDLDPGVKPVDVLSAPVVPPPVRLMAGAADISDGDASDALHFQRVQDRLQSLGTDDCLDLHHREGSMVWKSTAVL